MNLKFWWKKLTTKQKEFTGEVTYYRDFTKDEYYFNDLKNDFHLIDNEFYNQYPVLFDKNLINISPDGLKFICIKNHGKIETWQRAGFYDFKSAMVTTWNHDKTFFTQVGGTWILEAKFPTSWAALWLLHTDYYSEKKGSNVITPEVDFAECNLGMIENVVHYGIDPERYSTKGKSGNVMKPDGKFHQFAVSIVTGGYDFYLDGYLMNSFRSKDPEFTAHEQPYYLIINNAPSFKDNTDYSELIIRSIKVLK